MFHYSQEEALWCGFSYVFGEIYTWFPASRHLGKSFYFCYLCQLCVYRIGQMFTLNIHAHMTPLRLNPQPFITEIRGYLLWCLYIWIWFRVVHFFDWAILMNLCINIQVRILCGVEHDDLKRLFDVSKSVRAAVCYWFSKSRLLLLLLILVLFYECVLNFSLICLWITDCNCKAMAFCI